jgi:hypothetical protein
MPSNSPRQATVTRPSGALRRLSGQSRYADTSHRVRKDGIAGAAGPTR